MTLRERLEAIRDLSPRVAITEHAEAALADLDAARHAYRCAPGCRDCDLRDERRRSGDVRVAIIDDPERADAVDIRG